jgi:hypothetical protein
LDAKRIPHFSIVRFSNRLVNSVWTRPAQGLLRNPGFPAIIHRLTWIPNQQRQGENRALPLRVLTMTRFRYGSGGPTLIR